MTLRLSVRRKEIPVEIEELDGKVRTYTLRALGGSEREEFLSLISQRTKVQDGRAVGMKDTRGLQPRLVSMSLFDPDGKQVPEATILTWAGEVLDALFKEAHKLSGLDREAEQAAKKPLKESEDSGSESPSDSADQ